MKSLALSVFCALALSVAAQQAEYAQCGGQGWTGGTTCVAGTTCQALNAYYSQCLPGTASSSPAPASSTTAHPTSTSTTTHSTSTSSSASSTVSTASPSSTTKPGAGGYIQPTSGTASFTEYSGCSQPACGIAASGFTAAMSQLSFGSEPGIGPGDACGRCFAITGTKDPYSPAFTGPFGQTIVVMVTDMCPLQGNQNWCGQTTADPVNSFGTQVHFDLCEDTGAPTPFFPSGHTALTGNFTEVPCSQWGGSGFGSPLWNGACIAPLTAPLWPSVACGNQGTAPS